MSRPAVAEGPHLGLALGRRQAAVHQAQAQVGEDLAGQMLVLLHRRLGGDRLRFLDQRADDVGLPSLLHLLPHEAVGLVPLVREGADGLDPLPARRHLIDERDVQVAVDGEGQGARDGRGGHHQHVGTAALGPQRGPLHDAEAMLLVHHHQAQAGEVDLLLDEGVGADGDVHLAAGRWPPGRPPCPWPRRLPVRRATRSGLPRYGGWKTPLHSGSPPVAEEGADRAVVLLGQDLGGGHDRPLAAAGRRRQQGGRGHHRLAAAHVALEEAAHGHRRGRYRLRSRPSTRRWAPVSEKGNGCHEALQRRRGRRQRVGTAAGLPGLPPLQNADLNCQQLPQGQRAPGASPQPPGYQGSASGAGRGAAARGSGAPEWPVASYPARGRRRRPGSPWPAAALLAARGPR